MILFQSDWARYPAAIVDTRTTNTSFLRIAALYRDMGVKNHAFPLALLNPQLQGIDPFDPNLTLEQMAAIALECRNNFFYFIREIAKEPGISGITPGPIRANRGNMALYWLFFNHITNFLIQIRQTGKSFSVRGLFSYLMNLRCVNTEINAITKDDKLRADTLTKLKGFDEEFPFYLRQRTKSDIANTEELRVSAMGNSFKAHLSNKSPKAALNLGRGLTSPIFYIDEAAHLYNIAISLPAALAGGGAARDIAKRNNEPFGTILTGTAGKKDDKDGRYMHTFAMTSALWTEAMLDCKDLDELELVIRKNSPTGKLRVHCVFNHQQLGYTDAWLKDQIERAESVGDDANRDFFNIWTSGSLSSPITAELADQIRQSEKADPRVVIDRHYGYVTRWYATVEEIATQHTQSHFVLSIDSSEAVGNDDIGLVVREIRTGAVIAAGSYNETNLITFCEWLVTWFTTYANLTAIIERRSTGAMILDYLLLMLPAKGIDPFKRLYNKAVQEKEEHPDRFHEINAPLYARTQDLYTKHKKCFGFSTSGTGLTSRVELYSTTLTSAAKNTGATVHDSKTINQILGLEIRNGRVDHAEGEHDDQVIAWMLSYWFMTQAKHLDHYGLDGRQVLLANRASRAATDPMGQHDAAKQIAVRQQIDKLIIEMQKERDEMVLFKLETQLRTVASQLKLVDNEVFSVDDLVRTLRTNRRTHQAIAPPPHSNSYGRYY